ncbi:aspartyl/glutamyl-tRNA(Asn/Gln) amidotransferase subunit B [Natranaerovirga hydrolytica]|uniref:Aspartyl/glutamyl-tRNA(Asn/Gln) amidotransferase subunit B n=1 Tax=Natranaerovirga hydrolytica TaxID=680378 RepID=A0A4R1MLD1_9FIRM|nr:Asp-tRNA(Asn)/Glu-tRNA(Gln) amidotransferase subunit GatB [Natranaerovirga hydrolytica]TCK92890.1 aspartyl/glutamyl-tRNA(Asn/Gln) amidotransferase subunit B [Natranaerovirga hydrolytica]
MSYKDYEIVIGLEVHCELKTESKIFCGCTTQFGGDPNTHCCPICTGMPGTLPVLNGDVVEYAIRAGLATNCKISEYSKQDRKNYFYPDLPKAYQVSQYDLPLCYEGEVEIDLHEESKKIGITRIHIEEDAGKLLHESGEGSLVDYNRCGVPLIEIVTEPDLRSPEEVGIFMQKLRSILLYSDVSDCKMNEGSLRCDVNLSVRKKGSKEFGTRTEMKNINSFNFAVKAAEYEAKRQIKAIENGEAIIQETRRWDDAKGITISMRSKEEAHDYRYFPEPDLMPIVTPKEKIEAIRQALPEMPDTRKKRYMEAYGLSTYDADLIVASRNMADYYEEAAKASKNPKAVANWIMTEIFSRMTEDQKEEANIPFESGLLAELVNLIEQDIISNSIGKKVFNTMWETGKSPNEIVEEEGLKQISDDGPLIEMAKEVIEGNEKVVNDYLSGKEQAVQALMGQMMKKTKGQANPKKVIDILKSLLNEMK